MKGVMALSPWQPITVKIDLKHLGKLAEELSECNAAASRCIIQGIDEKEPVTGKPNREWLTEEIADVLANVELVTRHFNLDRNAIHRRKYRKIIHLAKWHGML